MTTSLLRHWIRVAAALFTAAAIAGCGVRVGSPPDPVPAPDAAETARQSLAVAIEQVLIAARASEEDSGGELAATAEIYLDALGGTWVPPARPEDPDPLSPALIDPPPDELAAVVAAEAEVLTALTTAADDRAPALASVWLTLRTARAALTGETVSPCTQACTTEVIPDLLGDPQGLAHWPLRESIAARTPELAMIYDALGYLEEIQAARAPAAAQEEHAAHARNLRDLAEGLTGDAGGTPADLREGAYPVSPTDVPEAISRYLADAVSLWLVHAGSGDEVVLEALWRAYASVNPTLRIETWPGLDPALGPAAG